MPSQEHRITQSEEYRRVMRRGRRVGGQFIVTHAVLSSPELPARFGYVTSRRVGNAVVRNLITRRLKGLTDELLHEGVTGVDVVFRALPTVSAATYQQLRDEARRQLSSITGVDS